ncbi:scavenger receptor class F member 1-like isoform X1 [Haliotis rufescens]|uniref:scavenger receptor class F member 1-like isoform X1 n=1 Tax=Haliotis rufescens TaxID=6454 RepID=UPI00201F0B83|nr:scavenger receptor class F member 1-like isoform X1 [Haliotis rufescens]
MKTMTTNLILLLVFICPSSAYSNCLRAREETPCPECVSGWYGSRCDNRCIGFCDNGGCHRDSGQCLQCQGGYYTSTCTTKCPLHCRENDDGHAYCDQTTGHCSQYCKDGWWGDRCERACSEGCVDNSCFSWDGYCNKGCLQGWTGDGCGTRCPSGCHQNACEQAKRGRCTQGCRLGFHGHHCDQPCDSRCREQDCVYDHHIKSAVCRQGCVDGWMSPDCQRKCSRNCEACLQESGNCFRCTQGYWGVHCASVCSSMCSHGTCDMDGKCFACQPGYFGKTCERHCGTDCARCEMMNKDGRCDDVCVTLCSNDTNGLPGPGYVVPTDERNTSGRCGNGFLQLPVTLLLMNLSFHLLCR